MASWLAGLIPRASGAGDRRRWPGTRRCSAWFRRQQAFFLDANQFGVGDDPGLVFAAAAAFFLGTNTSEAAPLADGELRLAQQRRRLLGGVIVLDSALSEKVGELCLDPV